MALEVITIFENITTIAKYIATLIGSLAAPIYIYIKINQFRSEKATELHDKYKILKSLISEPETNMPEILIVLKGISKVELTREEIIWFINEPGAFMKLKEYGNLKWRYSNINFEKGEFDVSKRIATGPRIAIETTKIVVSCYSYIVFFTIGFKWIITASYGESAIATYVITFAFLLNFTMILYGSAYIFRLMNKAINLKGKPSLIK